MMIILLSFVIGTCFGSFFCLVIERSAKGESIVFPRSKCGACGTVLQPIELIPVVSVLLQRFRCRHCHCRLSGVYLLAEVLFGCFGMFAFCQPFSFQHIFACIWLFSCLLLSLTDLFFYYVEPKILYASTALLLGLSYQQGTDIHWENLCILAVVFFLLMKLLPEKLGDGDVKLLLCWSLFLTLHQLALLIFCASLLGLCAFFLMKVCRVKVEMLPFVPFLSAALAAVLAIG